MKKILTVLFLILSFGMPVRSFASPLSASFGALASKESMVKRTFKVGSFNKIHASSIIEVIFIQGKATGEIQVSAPSHSMPFVKVEVKNKELCLSFNSDKNSHSYNGPITVTVQAPTLQGVETNGAASFNVKGELNMKEKFSVEASGASKLKIPVLRTTGVLLNLSGATSVKMDRIESSTLKLSCSGASNLKVADALSPTIYIDSSGTANITIGNYSGEKLNATTSGVSKTEVKTTDANVVNLDSSGVSSLKVSNIDAKVADVEASGEAVVYVWGKAKTWNKNTSGGGKIKTNVGTSSSSSKSKSRSTSKSSSKSSSKKSSHDVSKKSVPTQAP